jgi:hypothetical protein
MAGSLAPLREGDARISTATIGFTVSKHDPAPPEMIRRRHCLLTNPHKIRRAFEPLSDPLARLRERARDAFDCGGDFAAIRQPGAGHRLGEERAARDHIHESWLDCARAPSNVGAMSFFRCDLRFVSMIALLAGAATAAGCSSDCASNCPNLFFDVLATTGENLNVQQATFTGSACPTDVLPTCRGDVDGTNLCVRFTIQASAPGSCELALVFSDGRLPFRATAQFGEETHQGCCHGFPVTGPAVATVPPLHPIIGFDASPDSDGGDDGGAADAPSD